MKFGPNAVDKQAHNPLARHAQQVKSLALDRAPIATRLVATVHPRHACIFRPTSLARV